LSRFLDILDGTGRPLFPVQRDFLAWLQEQKGRVIAGQLPPGTGKSLIVRTIQRATGATVVTPSNLLVDQYSGTYPDVNVLKGADHYDTIEEYRDCREAALEGKATFFNPISLHYLVQSAGDNFKRARTTVVDEAHTLSEMLLLAAGHSFTDMYLPSSEHASDVIQWLERQKNRLSKKTLDVLEWLKEDPSNYTITLGEARHRERGEWITRRTLSVKPLLPPKSLLDDALGKGRIILLSGTLSRLDASILAPGEDVTYIDMPSPIPANQRQVLYRPRAYATDRELYEHMLSLHNEFGGPTIVHVSYALSERLGKFAVSALRNTPDNKDKVVARFKAEGGLFFASGCAEGLDLPDGQCRLNIVPVLPRPNIGDQAVKKWLAQPGGSKRYDLETLRTFQQQVGRSTRHVNDWSVSVVCDPRFPELVRKNRSDISNSFYESLVWTGKKRG
jgi:Rad3-related DNA helicase